MPCALLNLEMILNENKNITNYIQMHDGKRPLPMRQNSDGWSQAKDTIQYKKEAQVVASDTYQASIRVFNSLTFFSLSTHFFLFFFADARLKLYRYLQVLKREHQHTLSY